MNRRESESDVVVVGAGAAGLLAARELARAGRSVRLIEARARLGGRMFEVEHPRSLAPIELGAEFVHGTPEITYALLREFGTGVVATSDVAFTARDGPLRELSADPFAAASELLAHALERPDDENVEATIERAVRSGAASREAGDWTRRLVSGFDAADPALASARGIAAEWSGDAGGDGSQSRPLGGYGPLVAHLARTLPPERVALAMQTAVERIAYAAHGVTIFARDAVGSVAFHARHVLVTVPLGVLQAAAEEEGAIVFEPPLPAATQSAIHKIAMGPVVKVVLCFRTAFWETLNGGAWRDAAFIMSDGAFPTFWTQLPIRANTLVAWAGGPAARALHGATNERYIALALESAASAFGEVARTYDAFESGYVHDWQSDPYARGAYSYLTVGGEHAREALAESVLGTLFLCGEATATGGEGGTVAGALASGARAAQAILAGSPSSRANGREPLDRSLDSA